MDIITFIAIKTNGALDVGEKCRPAGFLMMLVEFVLNILKHKGINNTELLLLLHFFLISIFP